MSSTLEALHSLVASIPPKTLHAYVLDNMPAAPPDTLASLASFFATLSQPQLLHCVRCHKDYVDVENGNRSCRMPHDENNIDIEWVGHRGRNSEYETEYHCCGKTVDGEGDEGPPDGWCFEGKHTVSSSTISFHPFPGVKSTIHIYLHLLNFCTTQQTDVRLARYRDDAESGDDKLKTCLSLKCHKIRARRPTTKTAATAGASTSGRVKRARPPSDEAEDYEKDGGSEDTGDARGVEIARGVGALGPKSKGKGKGKARASSKIDLMAERPVLLSSPQPLKVVPRRGTKRLRAGC